MDYKDTLMYKEICQTPSVFANIMQANSTTMDALCQRIAKSNINGIYGVARGTSDHALTYFKYLAEIYTPYPVALGACSVATVYEGQLNHSGKLVVGVSQSGKAADVLAVLKKADLDGAITVAITNDEQSPMAHEANFHLYCACGEEKSVAATKTFSAQMFLLLWLAAKMGEKTSIIDQLKTLGSELQGNMQSILDTTQGLVDKLVNAQDGFVLSRGITYPLALETALKLQETSYIKIKGYAFSDFQHGPMAMIGNGTPVVFLAPNAPYLQDLNAVAQKLASFGGDISIITNTNMNFASVGDVYKISSNRAEELAIFDFILFIQLLAARVSCARGNNPDSPRALNKVTITK